MFFFSQQAQKIERYLLQAEMVSYTHYSVFFMPASFFSGKGMKGRKYANGWIVSSRDFKPWYLEKELGEFDVLPTEMTYFVPTATTIDESTGMYIFIQQKNLSIV